MKRLLPLLVICIWVASVVPAAAIQRPVPIPEPSTFALFGTGLAVVGLLRRRFKK